MASNKQTTNGSMLDLHNNSARLLKLKKIPNETMKSESSLHAKQSSLSSSNSAVSSSFKTKFQKCCFKQHKPEQQQQPKPKSNWSRLKSRYNFKF